MCVGIPMRVISVDGIAGHATDGTHNHVIDLSLTGPQEPGTWVLTHLGAAREVISEQDAFLIGEALNGLRAIMAGGDPGAAFADLDNRAPTLPPHLLAAQARGDTTG